MFGWFRKTEKQVPVKDAYDLGRRAVESANADIEAYMEARFYPGIQGIVDVVFGDLVSPDLPPLILARIDLKNFLERVDDLRPRVLPQLHSRTEEWADVMKQAGLGGEFERLIEHHYDQFKSTLVLTAFQKLLDMTDALKEADDRWRAANPEKASQFPVDTLGPELGDVLAPYIDNAKRRAARA